MNPLQPEPVPPRMTLSQLPQTVSTQPRVVVVDLVSAVPPTAMTYCDDAGYSTP